MTAVTCESTPASADSGPAELAPTRVLIVDDSFQFRSTLSRLLRREAGITVVGRACNGDLALRMVRRLHPDVVLLDITMRGMDGIEAARRICAEYPSISVIGLSSHAVNSDEGKAMQKAGAVEYVCKGTDGSMGDQVIAAIRRRAKNGAAVTSSSQLV